jgi:succinoglycan biosynthesis protein ExoA
MASGRGTVMNRSGNEALLDVSAIVPVLNEEQDIGRLLVELLTQDFPRGTFEVLVVDGGSTDGTRRIVADLRASHRNLQLLENPGRRSSSGRNVGIRAARGRFILFIDGHCTVPRKDYLARLVELFTSTGADCLARPQPLDQLAEGPWGKAIAAARHSWIGHNYPSDIYGGPPGFTNPRSAGAAYRRECVEQLGGFDERFDACEDVEFNHRLAEAGFRSYRHPDLTLQYRPRSTPSALYRQMLRYGEGRARLLILHPRTAPWPLILLTVFVVSFPVGLISFGLTARALIFCAPLSVWMFLVVFESIRLRRTGVGVWRIAAALLVIYAGLTFGFWRTLPDLPRFLRRDARYSRLDSDTRPQPGWAGASRFEQGDRTGNRPS